MEIDIWLSKLAFVLISTTIVLFSFGIVDTVNGLTPEERYETGYGHGCSDARAGGHPYLDGHPTHTKYFMNGYNAGYADCSDTEKNKSVNRQNAFSDQDMCKSIEKYLMKSCEAYVKSNGVLTTEGKTAKGCISNGLMLVGGGTILTEGAVWLLGPSGIIGVLKPLAQATGCGGIVDWQLLENDVTSLKGFLNLMGIR